VNILMLGLLTVFPIITSSSIGPAIDIYTERGGEGFNQPSEGFNPGEQVCVC
jgi:hypothetical protein